MTWINPVTGALYEGDCQSGDREATAAELKPALRSRELKALSAAHKADLDDLNIAWLSAAVADGEVEVSKKATVAADITARKTQYLNDVAAVKAKYA